MRPGRLLAPLLALALGSSCLELQRSPGVLLATEPPGARIVVDGEDSGFVTPCNLGLSRERHRIELVLPGYQTARVQVDKGGQTQLVYWREAYVNSNTWNFPTWLNYEDGFAPVKLGLGFEPSRIHVPLRLASVE